MIRYQIIIMRVISNESKGTILLYGLIDGVGATDSLVRVGFVFLRRRLVRLLSWSVAVILQKQKPRNLLFAPKVPAGGQTPNRKSENYLIWNNVPSLYVYIFNIGR